MMKGAVSDIGWPGCVVCAQTGQEYAEFNVVPGGAVELTKVVEFAVIDARKALVIGWVVVDECGIVGDNDPGAI